MLEFPGISADIERWTEVEVTYQDETGTPIGLSKRVVSAGYSA